MVFVKGSTKEDVMSRISELALVILVLVVAAMGGERAARAVSGDEDRRVQAVIDEVEKECLEGPGFVPTIGAVKARRLAELVREAKPRLVVECGTAIGYSGLWIARELKTAGKGRLITIEIDPQIANRAEENFRRAGLAELVTVKVGDARKVVREIEGPIDFAFLDCDSPNYLPCLKGLEKNLAPGAIVVADNVGVSARQSRDYLKFVKSKYESRTEWFDVNLPWAKRDAMEVTVINSPQREGGENVPPPGFTALFNGRDFSGWKVPEGDGGHWKVIDGVIDYDAESEAKGDKSLWTTREFGDFILRVDWRIKETPYVNPGVPYILPDGTHARDIQGREMRLALPDSDSGICLRGSGRNQVNIWCWPIGSGELYGYRTDPRQPPEIRAGVTPRTQADNPVGEWNRFEITLIGDRITVVLNGKTVIENAQLPGIAPGGAVGLQHHGGKRDGKWVSPPSLLQFKNIFIKEFDR
jgi:predicted O-methyltransferase YrrM